jgi:mannose-6-phosphate isomerase-like protein (cupin superfamily)
MQILGGLNISTVSVTQGSHHSKVHNLGKNPYTYDLIDLPKGEEYLLEEPCRCCILGIGNEQTKLFVNEASVSADEYFLGNVKSIKISTSLSTSLLLARCKTSVDNNIFSILKFQDAKRVNKPWGYEIWFTGDPAISFAFKKIFIKAGNRTSLQYHKLKRETNFILNGSAKLFYSEPEQESFQQQVTVQSGIFAGPFVVDVFPNKVHRLEALTDLLLYEVSTPELDDVIRLTDDTGRSDGRINHEHE